MLPLIPLALALAQYAPKIIGQLAGDKAEENAKKVVNIAKSITGFNDSEQAVEAIKASPELQLKFQEQAQDFFLQYFTATIGKDEPWYSPSKLFRPLCSFAIVIFYVVARIMDIEFDTTDQTILFGVVGFWFGGRTLEKLFNKQ